MDHRPADAQLGHSTHKRISTTWAEYGIKLSSVVKRGPNRLLSPAFLLIWYRQMIINCRENFWRKESYYRKNNIITKSWQTRRLVLLHFFLSLQISQNTYISAYFLHAYSTILHSTYILISDESEPSYIFIFTVCSIELVLWSIYFRFSL